MRNLIYLTLLSVMVFTGCKTKPFELVDGHNFVQKPGREKKDWQLVWQDDFDGSELDTSRWTRIPSNNADWGRHMTSDDRCYALSDGKLFLKGIVNPDTLADPRPFLTGGIYSKGKFAFQYGRVEVHIPLYIRSRFPVISVHCLFKNGIVNVKLILFSQTLSFQLESDRFMHNPVEACLCNQFISNHVIPVGNRKLTRDYQ